MALLAAGCAAASASAPNASRAMAEPSATAAPMGATRIMPGTSDVVAEALVSEMTDRQYILTDRNATTLAFDRPVDNSALWSSLGGSAAAMPHARVIMTLTPMGAATSVTADMILMVPGAGGAPEQVSDARLAGIDPRMGLLLDDASQVVMAQSASTTTVASAIER